MTDTVTDIRVRYSPIMHCDGIFHGDDAAWFTFVLADRLHTSLQH